MLNSFKHWFARLGFAKDARPWIILFLVLRLYGITNPPLEHSHNWRQVTGTMVARNFVETDNNILYPRTDETNGGTGIIGMEFPLLNYLIYLVSLVFGYTHWYGRLINLIVSSIGTYYFFLILRRFVDDKAALPATIVFLASLWLSFSRKTMPDTFSLSLGIVSLYYGLVYMVDGHLLALLGFLLFFLLGVMSKLPAILMPVFLVIPFLSSTIPLQRKALVALVGLIGLAPVVWWYFVWCPHLSATYGNWYNNGRSLHEGITELLSDPGKVFSHFYFDALRFTGFAALLAGVALVVIKRQRVPLAILGVALVILPAYMIKSGKFFVAHDYYMLPYVPILCVFVGYAISLIPNRLWRNLALLAIVTEGIASQLQDFRIHPYELYRPGIEQVAKQVCPPNQLVAVNDGPNPQMLYFSHRKGWTITSDLLTNQGYLKSLYQQGCRYLLIDKSSFNTPLPYTKVYDGEHFVAYQLGF